MAHRESLIRNCIQLDPFSLKVLPRPDPRRAASHAALQNDTFQKSNLVDQYTALVLAIFIDAGLVEVGPLAQLNSWKRA